MSLIRPSTLKFLTDLKANNNREWFTENNEPYTEAHENMLEFMGALIGEMDKIDNIEDDSVRRSLFRIYSDVRFSKNKTPYKSFFGGRMRRATSMLRGGYYIHIEPGNTFLTGGFRNPSPSDLKLIRTELAHDAAPLRAIMEDEEFKNTWGTFVGKSVKTAPRGFDADHPDIDLIRMKQFRLVHPIADDIVLSENFIFEIVKSFLTIRPFFNYMSEVLTRPITE